MERFTSALLSKSLLEKPRTPEQFQAFVREIVAAGNQIASERHAAFQKKGLYKPFIDEFVPLSTFVNLYQWDRDVQVALVLGNQRYDARVFGQDGQEVCRIELANPHDGSWQADQGRKLAKRGIADLRFYDASVDIGTISDIAFETAKKKANIPYGNCLLVFNIDYPPPTDNDAQEYREEVIALAKRLEAIQFQARKVFVLDSTAQELWELEQDFYY